MSDKIWIYCLALCIVTQTNLYSQLLIAEGDIDLKDHQVINLADPVNDLDAATKAYADQVVTSFAISVLGTDAQTLLDAGLGPLELMIAGIEKDSLYGKLYQGGFIFYLDDQDTLAGVEGMVAALTDLPNNTKWGCYEVELNGADGLDIGTGYPNTQEILTACDETGIAAAECADLSQGGYSDWFLPSSEELRQMHSTIGGGAPAPNNNVGGFHNNYLYWSSSEQSSTQSFAATIGSGTLSMWLLVKSADQRIRPVRSF